MQRPAYLFRMKYVTPEGEKRERTELLHLLSVDKVQVLVNVHLYSRSTS